jgi:threonine/homoserine/homoserine lactone efflux protein
MSPFLEGLLAGYGIAVPVGAIAVLIIGMALRCGFPTGFMAGAGAATADLLYAALASIAGAALARLLSPWALPLRLLGGVVLIALALWGLRRGLRAPADVATVEVCPPGRTYVQFFGLTVINPLTVVYFAALILGRDPATSAAGPAAQFAFVLGAGIASFSWQTFLAALGALAGRTLSARFRRTAVMTGNLVVLALGVRILVLALFD